MAKTGYRRERIDRGIKARSDDIFAIASFRELLYVLGPRSVAVLGLLTVPLLEGIVGIYWMKVLLISCIIGLLAVSWDLLAAVGLPSLGQALFFGVGGYIAGFLSHDLNWSPLYTIPVATIGGALICTLLLLPVLRLRGVYFGLLTLALPMLFTRVIEATKILGGTEGISGFSTLPSSRLELYLAVVALLAAVFFFRWLIDTDYGLILRGIKDNDRSVLAAGLNLTLYKAQAVFLAGLPGTFAGALLTHHYQFVGMPAFAMEYSLLPLASAVVGGAGTFAGAAVGAFILTPVSEILRAFGTLRMVIYAIILVVFAVGLPEGVFHYLQRKYYQFERLVPLEGAGDNGPTADSASH